MGRRVLFVDDEPGIRVTLPEILALHGFEVIAAATVSEALSHIACSTFDVLISDLNIGQPGDGFTVVSAMRRTQPECITFILTGYPAFETALQAIRSQVDDYLIKPALIPELVRAIEQKLLSAERKSAHQVASKRIVDVIRENLEEIVHRTLSAIKENPELSALQLTDEERIRPYTSLLIELAGILQSSELVCSGSRYLHTAALCGQVGRAQGYTAPMMIACLRLLENALYEVVDGNLLNLDISFVISDIRQLNNNLTRQLEEIIRAHQQAGRRLVFESSAKWTGWFCERCCWNRPVPASEIERVALASRINADFDAHDCEVFALEHQNGTRAIEETGSAT